MDNKFGDILKSIRIDRSLSQEELAKLLGTTKQVISRYENNQRTPKITVANEYAQKLGVSLNYLLGEISNNVIPFGCEPLPETVEVPVVGTIACGTPILAEENIEGRVRVPRHIHADFCLRCKGWSMIGDRIQDGDLVYIQQQPEVDDGEIAAVLIGEEATLKHVFYDQEHSVVTLRASNPAYKDFVYSGEKLDEIRILGKAVAFLSCIPEK